MEVPTIRPGYEFRVGNRPYSIDTVHNYKSRYRDDLEGVVDYPYCLAEPTVIADDGGATARALRARPELEFNIIVNIEGLGRYALMAPNGLYLDGDYPTLVPLEGQAGCEQAEKRALRTLAAREGYSVTRTRPYPVYDNS